jgi:phosphomannomutase/phosphoglucomutase
MRASNTTPVIVLRFEADNDAALDRIQREFKQVLLGARPELGSEPFFGGKGDRAKSAH